MTAPFYDRDGNPITLQEWSRLFEADRQIGDFKHGKVRVSTVWIGINVGWAGVAPLIFETMVFRNGKGCEMDRYATELEALAGHCDWVEVVRAQFPHRKTDLYRWAKHLPHKFKFMGVFCPVCECIPAGQYRPKGKGPRTIRSCPDCKVKWRAGYRAPRLSMREKQVWA